MYVQGTRISIIQPKLSMAFGQHCEMLLVRAFQLLSGTGDDLHIASRVVVSDDVGPAVGSLGNSHADLLGVLPH